MKTKTYNVYKFNELSEEGKQKAIKNNYDINISHNEWWEFIFDEAKELGFKITEFNLDRRRTCDIELIDSPAEICQKIIDSHGKDCDTYKLASEYLKNYSDLVTRFSDGINTDKVSEENESDFDEYADDLDQEFIKNLSDEYSSMLQKDYDYLTSEEAIIEALVSNDYDFTEDGKID